MSKHRHLKFWAVLALLALVVGATHAHQARTVSAKIDVRILYDSDVSGYIEREEVIDAIIDYFRGELSRDEVVVLIKSYLSRSPIERPSIHEAINGLPWLEDAHPNYVLVLRRLASDFPKVFWAVWTKPWIQGTDEDFAWHHGIGSVIYEIEQIAKVDDSAAFQVVRMPFLDTIETRNDTHTLALFLELSRRDPSGASRFLTNPELSDAMWPSEVALLYLESKGPEIVAALEGLPWIHDGIQPFDEAEINLLWSKASVETEVVVDLFNVYLYSPDAFLGLVEKPWVQDGFDIDELGVLARISNIARKNAASVARLVNMPFLETLDEDDWVTIQFLSNLSGDELEYMFTDPLLHMGITDGQKGTVALLVLRYRKPAAAAAVESLPWVEDGLADSEQDAVFQLIELGLGSDRALQAVLNKPWLQDRPNSAGVSVLATLVLMSSEYVAWSSDEATALKVINMPFLNTIDGVDAAALGSLQTLMCCTRGEIQVGTVLSHPTLQDGITDEDTAAVAALEMAGSRPELLEILLDPEETTIERRRIKLPYTEDMDLSVIHLTPEPDFRTLDILEEVLRRQEGFMKMPFPKTYAGLFVADVSEFRGGGGANGLLTVDPGLEEDEYIISHELAHTYWNLNPNWIAEGGADFFSAISADVVFTHNECGIADNLSELDHLEWERRQQGLPRSPIWTLCTYTLGRALFLDLHESLGDYASSAGFGLLYMAMIGETPNEDCMGVEKGYCYVTTAFVTHADEEAAAIAEPIIRRHYYGE